MKLLAVGEGKADVPGLPQVHPESPAGLEGGARASLTAHLSLYLSGLLQTHNRGQELTWASEVGQKLPQAALLWTWKGTGQRRLIPDGAPALIQEPPQMQIPHRCGESAWRGLAAPIAVEELAAQLEEGTPEKTRSTH